MQPSDLHYPVMLAEVLLALAPKDKGIYLDATFGDGGYSAAILGAAQCRLGAIDRDPDAVLRAHSRMAEFADRFQIFEGPFSALKTLTMDTEFAKLDGIVFDLGVSSPQLDEADRGFSFRFDGPLDMRMSKQGLSAAEIVNRSDEKELAHIIWAYGEDRAARRIARAIVKARDSDAITRTRQLAEIVRSVLPRPKPGQMDPATRTFQALRIEVNGELDQIREALVAAEQCLKPDGALVVVSFHSLEDRIVKQFLTARSAYVPQGSRHRPAFDMPEPSFHLNSRKPALSTAEECAKNPRSRSAKMRVGTRTNAPAFMSDFTPKSASEINLSEARQDYS